MQRSPFEANGTVSDREAAATPTVSRRHSARRRSADARPPVVLVLFPKDWDRNRLAAIEAGGIARVVVEGFEIYAFPSALRIAWFDFDRWVDRLARRWAGRVDAIVSHHEPFGALVAAFLAERLGLPGTPPQAVIRAQHKLLAREALHAVCPDACPTFFGFPARADAADLSFPFFAKPVKATFSVLAREVHSRAELEKLLRLSWIDRLSLHALIRPFDRVTRALGIAAAPAASMIGETIQYAKQLNYDGMVVNGVVHRLGIVEERMVPGTRAFGAFVAPARLPERIVMRCDELARLFLGALGFSHGCFNIEFFWDPASDRVTVIEANPRMAAQMADLHHWTLGIDPWRMEMALALGEDPLAVPRETPQWGAAGSMVWRTFDGRPGAPPRADGEAALAAAQPQARLMRYPKQGRELEREMKWLGSHRYAVMNLPARDREDLFARTREASALLGWPVPRWEDWPGG